MDLDEYVNNLEQLESYNALMNEYSETEILKEALLFMDGAFPEWNSNRGAGILSAEFLYDTLENLGYLQNGTKYTSKDILKDLYTELVREYQLKKAYYELFLIDKISTAFDIANEEFDEENKHLSPENYIALYKMQLNDFKKEYLNRVTFDFDF